MQVDVVNVRKMFGEKVVLDNLNFTARPGKVLGLLGPNGAGKTTTLRLILDILKPDEGNITFDEKPINNRVRDRIGYLPEERGLYQKYSAIEVLIYFGRLKNMSRKKAHVEAVRLLDRYDMIEYMDMPVSHFSKGNQQKLQLLVSIIHDPDILIFDEPFFGLDPLNQELVRKMIQRFREAGKTIILSTHQMVEAEKLCDDIVLIHQGKTVLKGTLSQILKKFQKNLITVEAEDNLQSLENIHGVKKVLIDKQVAHLYLDDKAPVQKVLDEIVKTIQLSRLEVNRTSLNDIFLEVVQNDKGSGK